MAFLVPADFDLSTLDAPERRVADALVEGLDDSWQILPRVPVGPQDGVIPLVLVSASHGAIAVEVAGGQVEVKAGRWYRDGHALERSPLEQAALAKHELVRTVRAARVQARLPIAHAVALPDVAEPGLLTGADGSAPVAFAELSRRPALRASVGGRVDAFVQALRPDLTVANGIALYRIAPHLAAAIEAQIGPAVELDVHRRVVVTGGAGTGKTRLAVRWAERAARRGERTLLACSNRPLAAVLTAELSALPVTVVTLGRPGDPPVRSDGTRELYDARRLCDSSRLFDTVIVDEAQDLAPFSWPQLEALFAPDGPGRLLVLGDPAQSPLPGWVAPPADATAELAYNLRSTGAIARLAQRLGGAPPHPAAPAGSRVRFLEAGDLRAARSQVRSALAGLHGVPRPKVAVLATRATVRAGLLASPPAGVGLARWEARRADAAVCETIERAKGLEATAVLLVALDDPIDGGLQGGLDASVAPGVDRRLLYVGITRASASLTVIGPRSLADRLGLAGGG